MSVENILILVVLIGNIPIMYAFWKLREIILELDKEDKEAELYETLITWLMINSFVHVFSLLRLLNTN